MHTGLAVSSSITPLQFLVKHLGFNLITSPVPLFKWEISFFTTTCSDIELKCITPVKPLVNGTFMASNVTILA